MQANNIPADAINTSASIVSLLQSLQTPTPSPSGDGSVPPRPSLVNGAPAGIRGDIRMQSLQTPNLSPSAGIQGDTRMQANNTSSDAIHTSADIVSLLQSLQTQISGLQNQLITVTGSQASQIAGLHSQLEFMSTSRSPQVSADTSSFSVSASNNNHLTQNRS
jgi:hypothetical protein